MSSHEERLDRFFETLTGELADLPPLNSERSYAVGRLASRMRKRAGYTNSSLDDAAITAFLANNDYVRDFTITLPEDIVANARYFLTYVLERYTKHLYPEAIQQPLELSYLFDNWRFGPGSSNGVKGTHTVDKIKQRMTCTTHCEPLVRRLRRNNPYFHLNDEENGHFGFTLVQGSRLSTVPKNEDTVRTIAIEPSGNMSLQLAAGRYLEGTLSYLGLNISTQQPKNKAMAMRGSIDDSIATIDLKSASDLISTELVRLLMPKVWYDLIMSLRSEEIELPNGEYVKLAMVSTMGNGFTFPLMTLLITSLIYGYRCTKHGPNLRIDWTNTCVFGDDIIIPKTEYNDFVEVLTSAGFIVNTDKSYSAGPFRESCGGDYYLGYDVTPFYVRNLTCTSDYYIVTNQVLEWCGKHKIFLHQTLSLLKSFLVEKVLLVPEWCNPDQGVRTALCSRRYKYLATVPYRKKYESSFFDMMLMAGGYITASGPDMFYTPRTNSMKVCVRKSRLPQGFRDGWDPLTRSRHLSDMISTYVEVLYR